MSELNFLSGKHLARSVHLVLIVIFFTCISIVYYYGLKDTFSNKLYFVSAILFLEALVLSVNRGRCPMEHVHRRFGDREVFFDHFVDPKLSPFVIPVVILITAVGFLTLYL